jgi:hypothetical protein
MNEDQLALEKAVDSGDTDLGAIPVPPILINKTLCGLHQFIMSSYIFTSG